MASLSRESGRRSWKLSWREHGRQRAIRLGAMPKRSAESFRLRFEDLLGVRRSGGTLSPALSDWIDSLGDDLRQRLANAGLVERRDRHTLGGLCDAFLESRSSVAPATRVRDRQVVDRLIERFGRDRFLDVITVRDAESWCQWIASMGNKRDSERGALADNTLRRRTGVARQVFATAVRWGMLQKNPFDGLATNVRENLERRMFITWSDMLRVIEVASDAQWHALLAFARLVGPRVPSELAGLRWSDVDLVDRRVVIRSPKTKHNGGDHLMRSVPLFPEVVPYMERWAELVGPGVNVPPCDPVFPMVVDPSINLRTQLRRLIVRSGLEPWPKLFVNLRSSRETELLSVYPAADVCRWMGHSPAVAAKFYAQARPEVAERAARELTVGAESACDSNNLERRGGIGAFSASGERSGEHVAHFGADLPADCRELLLIWSDLDDARRAELLTVAQALLTPGVPAGAGTP